ncbi:hypothetical protein WN48_02391 [Eufriesea mexicana]|nr:hypothetical protein WN48_02391 [Eufriesea mexicana]
MKLLVSTRGPCWAVAGQDRHFASQPHGVELNHPCGLTVDGTSPSASMCPSPSRVRLRQRTAPSRSEDALIRGGHPGTRCMTRLTVTGNECRRRVVEQGVLVVDCALSVVKGKRWRRRGVGGMRAKVGNTIENRSTAPDVIGSTCMWVREARPRTKLAPRTCDYASAERDHEACWRSACVGSTAKHKRKVQNLLPCKSAAGAAAAAAAAAAGGRSRVLADGQSHGGTGSAGGAVLYEDLPEAVTHSQLHHRQNHLPSHHPGQAPTIEVRNPDQRHGLRERQPQQFQRARAPAPHHLDYLDYRDPRAILRVQDKPSRAVLGGYRTPRALLAKSKGIPLSIATHTPSPRCTAATSPLLQNGGNVLWNSHLLLANQNALITSQQPLPPAPPTPSVPCISSTCPDIELNLTNESYLNDSCVSGRPIDSRLPITPTHRSRIQPASDRTHASVSSSGQTQPVQRVVSREEASNGRRPSVDSEGYSYIDFKDTELESTRHESCPQSETLAGSKASALFRSSSAKSNSVDSDGYSYIVDSGSRKAPGTARRIVAEGTEEEVCPLCTMQQIHNLLSKPEDIYLNVQTT